MAICHVCQKSNPAGAEYCEDCGAALPVEVAVAAAVTPQTETPAAVSAPVHGAAASAAAEVAPGADLLSAAPGSSAEPTPPEGSGNGPAIGVAPLAPADAGTSAAGGARPRLLVKRFGAVTGDEIPLQGDRLVVGRFDPETGPVDIDLSSGPEAEYISRQHGEFYREADGRWMVRDLGSTNGVFAKGSSDASFGPRITAPRPLANGDEVAFGNTRFVFKTD